MAQRSYRPMTPSRRFMTSSDFSEITKSRPEKALLAHYKKTGGRNFSGRQTCPHNGRGHKRRYRIIDFRRGKIGIPARVAAVEYDPNRTCRIALLVYADGEKRYIMAATGVNVGDTLMSGPTAEVRPGNCLPLANIPLGQMVHNVETKLGGGGQLGRAAGTTIQLLAKEGEYAQLRMPSGEVRKVLVGCYATIGQVGNADHKNMQVGKAGRKRWLGWHPRTRATSKNPCDHPLGGGEGRTKGGRHPCSRKGQLAKGLKTRKNKRTAKFIVRGRRARVSSAS